MAEVHLIDHCEFQKFVPDGRTATGRARGVPAPVLLNQN